MNEYVTLSIMCFDCYLSNFLHIELYSFWLRSKRGKFNFDLNQSVLFLRFFLLVYVKNHVSDHLGYVLHLRVFGRLFMDQHLHAALVFVLPAHVCCIRAV